MSARPVWVPQKRSVRSVRLLLLLSAPGIMVPEAGAIDVFRTELSVPDSPAGRFADMTPACQDGPLGDPLPLAEAVNRTLCGNPATRQAWAGVKAQAAAVGVARSAWLPTVTASLQDGRGGTRTEVKGYPLFGSSSRSTTYNGSLSGNWILYDFGGRKAALDNAEALLAAARANEDVTLRSTFSAVVGDYYATQAAAGKVLLAREAERLARDSLAAASARVTHGVASVSDRLQAQTAYAQSVVSRARAEGAQQIATGVLAADMNLRPDQPLTLPDVDDGVMPDRAFSESVSSMIDDAQRMHPSVVAARAKLDAAVAGEAQTRAEGLPSLSLTARYGQNNQPASLGLGEPQFPATGRDWYVGVQVQFPLFEGLSRTYKLREARAQIEQQHAVLDEARQQVGMDVWKSFQILETSTENARGAGTLSDIAQQSFEVAKHRYTAGVGNILELLGAQRSLSEAKQQRLQALTDWRIARLQLAARMGALDQQDISRRLMSEP